MTNNPLKLKFSVLSIGLLLVLTPFVQVLGQNSGAATQPSGVPYADYGLSALGSGDRITLNLLEFSTGNNLTVAGFESYIEHNLTPYDLRLVLLDIGWQNYTAGAVADENWVNNWFTACDAMGIQNVIYVGQLTTDGVGSPWIRSVIAMDPATQTSFSNGTAAEFISYDNPDIAIFLEKDLAKIYSYYGAYSSWVGIGTGSSANDPYYQAGQLFPGMGYSNLTISSFVNSEYYSSDVNGSGVLPNGQIDSLWASYRNVSPSILLSSGQLQTSSPVNVYGNGSASNYVEMRFELQANVTGLGISWYGNKVGNPGPMLIKLNADTNGSLDTTKLLASYVVAASSFTNVTGWQSAPGTKIDLAPGYYWITISSPASDKNNFYAVYIKDQVNSRILALAGESYVGPGFQHGSTILWLKDQTGRDVGVYPYQEIQVGNPETQTFVANSTFSFNTVFLYLSDRIYNPINGTITLRDLTANGGSITTGLLSQQLGQGIEGWVPISLSGTVTTIPGHVYTISLTEPNGGYSWIVALRGVATDPPSAGFQDQSSSWLFQLADLNFVQGQLGYHDMTINGVDAVTSGYLDAIRFMPSINETLKSVSILMASSQSGNYTEGELTVSVWNSSSSGLTPSSTLPHKVTVPATQVPSNGFLNVTGIDQPVIGGQFYWIVFSANSNESFSMGRFTNAYAFDVQVSPNGGTSWQEPREGPTDFGFVISLSNQNVGTFISGKPEVQIDDVTGYFAEPFYANETTQITGVYLAQPPGCIASVSINPDAGSDHPPLSPIASGILNGSSISGGAQFILFSSVANLRDGLKYWLVVHPISGTCDLFPLVYLPNDPSVLHDAPSIISQDDGLTWNKVSNTTSSIVYELASQERQLPQLNTSELASSLSVYHSPSLSTGEIHGWTGYIAVSKLTMFGQITSWLNGQTNKDFRFYGQGETNVLNQLPAKNEVLFPSNSPSTSCSSLADQLTAELPIAGVQYYNVADASLLEKCAGTSLGPLLQQLGYVLGTGESYGQASPTRVLVVGDTVSDNLTRYLSIAYNVTYSQLSSDPSLRGEGNLSRYAAIVWTSSGNPAPALESQLTKYVKTGGTLILAQFGGVSSDISSLAASLPDSNSTLSPPGSAILMSLVEHTSYTNLSVSSTSKSVQGDSSGVSIIIHNYGSGAFYLVWFSSEQASQVSDPTVLLSNMIASSKDLADPFWYDVASPPQNPAVGFSVVKTGSSQILVWVTNTGEQSATFSLHLNGSYYGVTPTWRALNLNDMGVSTGSGSDVVVGGDLPAGSWLPIFIVPYSSASLIDYSNVQVSGQFVYPHQSFYELSAVNGQEVLLLLSSNTTANQLIVDDSLSLPNLQTAVAFSRASSGWVYYDNSSALMVEFGTNGASTLRLLTNVVSVQTPVSPTMTVLTVFVILVCVEFVLLAVLALRRTSRHEPVRV